MEKVMNIDYTDTPSGDLIIKLQGEMGALGCSNIRTLLEEIVTTENNHNVVLNLAHVNFLDSSGIGVIVFLYKRLKAGGRGLKTDNVRGQSRELMELLRIGTAIPVKTMPEL